MSSELFNQMGYTELDPDLRLKAIVNKAKHINFHKIVNPTWYDKYYETDDLSEREQIKAETPAISKEEYASATVDTFISKLEDAGWHASLDGSRIVFKDPLGQAYFKPTNNLLVVYLTLFAEKLGVPENLVGLLSFSKTMMAHLKFQVNVNDRRENLNYE